jgi:hypothetical protein
MTAVQPLRQVGKRSPQQSVQRELNAFLSLQHSPPNGWKLTDLRWRHNAFGVALHTT